MDKKELETKSNSELIDMVVMLQSALINIKEHQKIVAGEMVTMSATYCIANTALNKIK